MIGNLPTFIEPNETKPLLEIWVETKRLKAHRKSFTGPALKSRLDTARAQYKASPTEENLANMEAEARHVQALLEDSRLRDTARDVLERYVKQTVLPFIRPILKRGLDLAQGVLAETITEESARCVRLIGTPLTYSDIIEAARRPVRWFEKRLPAIDSNYVIVSEALGVLGSIVSLAEESQRNQNKATNQRVVKESAGKK